jgi:hypothetical protein
MHIPPAQFPELIIPVDVLKFRAVEIIITVLVIIKYKIQQVILIDIIVHIHPEIGAPVLIRKMIRCIKEIGRIGIDIVPGGIAITQ